MAATWQCPKCGHKNKITAMDRKQGYAECGGYMGEGVARYQCTYVNEDIPPPEGSRDTMREEEEIAEESEEVMEESEEVVEEAEEMMEQSARAQRQRARAQQQRARQGRGGGGGPPQGGGRRGGGGGRRNINVNLNDRHKNILKRLFQWIVIGFFVLVLIIFPMLFHPVTEPFWDWVDIQGVDDPAEAAVWVTQQTASVMAAGVNAARMGVITAYGPMWCQTPFASGGMSFSGDMARNDLKRTNCIRKLKGKPPINKSEAGPEATFSVSDQLSIELRSEVKTDAQYLMDICGTQCGIAEVTLANDADTEITVTDLSLFVEAEEGSGLAPIIVAPESGTGYDGDERKRYLLKHFIRGTNELGTWTSTDDGVIRLEPEEEQIVTFMVNLSRYSTFSRSCWVDEVTESLSSRDKGSFDGSSCSDGVYKGGKIYAKGASSGSSNYERIHEKHVAGKSPDVRWLLESQGAFPDYSCNDADNQNRSCICKSEASEVADHCTEQRFQEFSYQYGVAANYLMNTTSTLNMKVTNVDYWGELYRHYEGENSAAEAQDRFRDENCMQITETVDILKQVSEPYPMETGVGLMIHTDCEVHYYPRGEGPASKRIFAKVFADEGSVDLFTIRKMLNSEGNTLQEGQVCNRISGVTEGYPWELDAGDTWYLPKQEEGEAESPVEGVVPPKETVCNVPTPAIAGVDTQTLTMGAQYEALTMERGTFEGIY